MSVGFPDKDHLKEGTNQGVLDLLNPQGGGLVSTNPDRSVFAPKTYPTSTDIVYEREYAYSSPDTPTWGATQMFRIQPSHDIVTKQYLVFTIGSGITPSVAGGTINRFVNGAGYLAIKSMELRQGTRSLMYIDNMVVQGVDDLLQLKKEDMDQFAENTGFLMSDAERDARALAGQQTFKIELPMPWGRRSDHVLMREDTDDEISFIVTWNSKEAVRAGGDAGGGVVAALSAARVYSDGYSIKKEEKDTMLDDRASGPRNFLVTAGAYNTPVTIASQSTSASEDFVMGTDALRYIVLLLRTANQKLTAHATYDPFGIANVTQSFALFHRVSAVICPSTTVDWNQRQDRPRLFPRTVVDLNKPLIVYSRAHSPAAKYMPSGTLAANMLKGFTVQLKFSSALTENYELDVFSYPYRTITLDKGSFTNVTSYDA